MFGAGWYERRPVVFLVAEGSFGGGVRAALATAADAEVRVVDHHDLMDETNVGQPDLLVIDVGIVEDGLGLVRLLRVGSVTSLLPIIALADVAQSLIVDRVTYLAAGVDDLMVKPVDLVELVARVRSALGRSRELRATSPVTGLPGNPRIIKEIEARMSRGESYTLSYVDIDRFKSVSDAYGFDRAAGFIRTLGSVMQLAAADIGPPLVFVGHIGGDDFVVICTPAQATPLITRVVHDFEAAADQLYDPQDAERGYLELTNRRGRPQRPNLVTLSVGVAISTSRTFTEPREVVAVASEMKTLAKRHAGSYVAFDRRRRTGPSGEPRRGGRAHTMAEPAGRQPRG